MIQTAVCALVLFGSWVHAAGVGDSASAASGPRALDAREALKQAQLCRSGPEAVLRYEKIVADSLLPFAIRSDAALRLYGFWLVKGQCGRAERYGALRSDGWERAQQEYDRLCRGNAVVAKMQKPSIAAQVRRDSVTRSPQSAQAGDVVSKNLSFAKKPAARSNVTPLAKDSADPQKSSSVAGGVGQDQFTLQVGSFASLENAIACEKKFSRDFSSVVISKVIVHESTYFRVRIGSFASREEAQAFARRHLSSKNTAFSVVKE